MRHRNIHYIKLWNKWMYQIMIRGEKFRGYFNTQEECIDKIKEIKAMFVKEKKKTYK